MGYWKIYYDGGEEYSSDDGPPWQAPPSGVLIIALQKEREIVLEQGLDFFIWKDEAWLTVDRDGKDDYLFCQVFDHPKVCLRGRMVSHEEWKRVNLVVRDWLNENN